MKEATPCILRNKARLSSNTHWPKTAYSTTAVTVAKAATVSSKSEADFPTQACRPQEEAMEASGLSCSALQSALHSAECGDSSSCQNVSVPRPASLLSPPTLKGQSVSGGAPVGGREVTLVGGWPGWSFLTREPASQQDQTGCRVNHCPSRYLTKWAPSWCAATNAVFDNKEHWNISGRLCGPGRSRQMKVTKVAFGLCFGACELQSSSK